MNPKRLKGDEVEVRATLTSEGGRKLSCVLMLRLMKLANQNILRKPTEDVPSFQHLEKHTNILMIQMVCYGAPQSLIGLGKTL
jgi:hypothetical protein